MKTVKAKQRDWMMYRRNAQELAARIEHFWHSRGYGKFCAFLQTRIRLTTEGTPRVEFDIRSNLTAFGMPPK